MTKLQLRRPKAEKTERLAIRISEKDKFAIELLAQQEGLNISTLLMQLIKKPLREGLSITDKSTGEEIYIPDEAYDPLDSDRLVKLAMVQPKLLTDHEKLLWKVITEDQNYWFKNLPNLKRIREKWSVIETLANNLLNKYST